MAALTHFVRIFCMLFPLGATHQTRRLRLKSPRLDAGLLQQGVSVRASSASIKHMLQKIRRPESQVELGKMVLKNSTMPWELNRKPILSCAHMKEYEEHDLAKAMTIFCNADLGQMAEFYVDPKFAVNYKNWTGPDGWIPEAFVTYIGLKNAHKENLAGEMDLLVQSVHHFSKRPVIVANFGPFVPEGWTPEHFPNMILMHGHPIMEGKSFNFNKLRAMMFTKVRTGIILDADQWVTNNVDYMFRRSAEEGLHYPYPIMPVHWMSRDPDSSDMKDYPEGYTWKFWAEDSPKRSMRWAHAHPTWTSESLPFLAKWTSYVLAPSATKPPSWLLDQGFLEDEDLLNVALWAENVTKQWCKFDIPGNGNFKMLLEHSDTPASKDSKWFPRGIPFVFLTSHDAKDPEDSVGWLRAVWPQDSNIVPIAYDGKWFSSAQSLQAYDPSLKCMA